MRYYYNNVKLDMKGYEIVDVDFMENEYLGDNRTYEIYFVDKGYCREFIDSIKLSKNKYFYAKRLYNISFNKCMSYIIKQSKNQNFQIEEVEE